MTSDLQSVLPNYRKDNEHSQPIFLSLIISTLLLYLSMQDLCAQTIVGMGTENPNPNAVLELVSETNNQGLLVPRLSASAIVALSQQLSTKDNGLLVFVQDKGQFFYWWDGKWRTLEPATAGSNEQIPGSDTLSGTNTDQQTLSLTGKTLSIENGNSVDLSDINTDSQTLRLSGSTLAIQGGNEVDLSELDQDQQTLELAETELSISGGNSVDMSSLITDRQTLSLLGNNLAIDGGNIVNLSSINTDHQTLSLSENILTIENGNAVDLSSVNTDQQTLSLSGTTLSLSGSSTTVDLSPLQDGTGTDSQSLTNSKTGTDVSLTISGGNTTTFSVADNDDDSANEKITAANLIPGDILRIQEAGANHDIDFSEFQKKSLPASQVLVGNVSGVATPVSISGDITLNSDGTMTITLDAVTTAKIIDNAITAAKLADDAVTKDKIDANVAGDGLAQNGDGSLEIKIGSGGLQLNGDQLQLTNQGNGQILLGDGSQVNARTVSGDISLANTGAVTVTQLQGRPVDPTAPGLNEVLTWDGSEWTSEDVSLLPLGGSKQWYEGTSTPSLLFPLEAGDQDYYYDTDDNLVYRKVSGTWELLGGFNTVAPASINMGAKADSYRAPVLYIGDTKPVDGDNIGAIGDLYYSRVEEKLYYRLLDVSNGTIKWQSL